MSSLFPVKYWDITDNPSVLEGTNYPEIGVANVYNTRTNTKPRDIDMYSKCLPTKIHEIAVHCSKQKK
jgi:hypothetical protein